MFRLSFISLIALLTVAAFAVIAAAQSTSTANVEVRVWQSTSDAESLYISARPEGGRWDTLGTIPLDMSGLNSRGTYRYGDISLAVPLPSAITSEPSVPGAFSPVFGEGQHNGVHYYADEEGLAYVFVYDTTHVEATPYSGGRLGYKFVLVCEPSGYTHSSVVSAGEFLAIEGTFVEVSYQVGDLPLEQNQWRAKNYQQLNSLYLVTSELRGQSQVRIWLPNTVRTFDISGLHETVVQGNIDNCRQFSEMTE